jgi:AraC-like DNA-binding protein
MQKIEKGIPDPEYTVKDLESEMAMSHSKFYNKVKNLTGLSGKEFLQEMRLKRAAQLIGSNTELSVAEISDMSGFSDPKYFSTCFKAKFKVSPTEFK